MSVNYVPHIILLIIVGSFGFIQCKKFAVQIIGSHESTKTKPGIAEL